MATRLSASRRGNPLDPSGVLDTATKQYVDKLGRVGAPVVKTASSTACNSSTLVVTNCLYPFTSVSGGIYRIRFDGQYQCDDPANTCGFYFLHANKNNSLANTDPFCDSGTGKILDRSHIDGTGIVHLEFIGEFTASGNGNYTVGVAINMPDLGGGSDIGPMRLYANLAGQGYGNTLYLDRVA